MQANKMDRGSEALKTHLSGCDKLIMKQTRRGWCRECLGCEAKTEFKYYIGNRQVAHSLEDAGCCCRIFCGPIHPYKMTVKDKRTKEELLTVNRPLVCCFVGSCKCCCPCCYQKASVSSGGNKLGRLKENCWVCIPSFNVYDHENEHLFLVKPPTCCCGTMVNCCAEGNPCCGRGCCRSSFRVYAPGKGGSALDPYLGVILKKPKSLADELFTDADTFRVTFPKDATADQKGLLTGVAIYINSVFYEDWNDGNGGEE